MEGIAAEEKGEAEGSRGIRHAPGVSWGEAGKNSKTLHANKVQKDRTVFFCFPTWNTECSKLELIGENPSRVCLLCQS